MRTGSTWLCNIIAALVGRQWTFWEKGYMKPNGKYRRAMKRRDNLFVKVHMTDPKRIVEQIGDTNTKVLSITRNIYDIIVSKGFFFKFRDPNTRKEYQDVSDKEYINNFAQSEQGENIVEVWNMYNDGFEDENYLLIEYEELNKYTQKTIRKIADFLEIKVSDKKINDIDLYLSFENVSEGHRQKGEEKTSAFYRKGICGDYKNYLTKESIEFIDELIKNE